MLAIHVEDTEEVQYSRAAQAVVDAASKLSAKQQRQQRQRQRQRQQQQQQQLFLSTVYDPLMPTSKAGKVSS